MKWNRWLLCLFSISICESLPLATLASPIHLAQASSIQEEKAAIQKRLSPVGKVYLASGASSAKTEASSSPNNLPPQQQVIQAQATKAARTGEQVYQQFCSACHTAGIAGAPKLGDKEAWGIRIKKGEKNLLHSILDGLNNIMPVKGTCSDCSDQELIDTLHFMMKKTS